MDHIVQNVSTDLNVACGSRHVAAQLYKLLLYEEGAFFLPHQDSEKADHMFGTLAICLPSKHTGGDIHLSHHGVEHIINTDESSECDYLYAAWYADVTHEVKPVTSGNRLVLIYNLVQTNPAMHTPPSDFMYTTSRLKAVFSYWDEACNEGVEGCPGFLVYKLSHEYTKAALSCDFLKGSDSTILYNLKEAGRDKGFIFYLAHIEKEVVGSCEDDDYYGQGPYYGQERYHGYSEDPEDPEDMDSQDMDSDAETLPVSRSASSQSLGDCHKIIDVIDSSLKLTRVVDEDGRVVADEVDLDMADIAQGNIFSRAPDDEDYSGYTGNEGVSTTHFYRDSVIVLIPRRGMVDFKFRFAQKDSGRVLKWIKSLQNEVKHATKLCPREELERLCLLVTEHNRNIRTKKHTSSGMFSWKTPFDDYTLSQTAQAALQLDDVLLFEEAIVEITKQPSLEVFEAVQASIPVLGFNSLRRGATMAMQPMTHISEKWAALIRVGGSSFSESVDSKDSDDQILKDWITAKVHESLHVVWNVDANDGTALAEIAEKYGFEMLVKQIVPLVNKWVHKTPFALAFVSRLHEFCGGVRLSDATIESVYSQILMAALTSFDLKVLPEPSRPQYYPYAMAYPGQSRYSGDDETSSISGEHLMQILQECETLLLEQHVAMLLGKVQEWVVSAPTTIFRKVMVPYLASLLSYLKNANAVCILGHDCGQHALLILESYILRYVEQEPKRAPTWARPSTFVTCGCKDCTDLKAFIRDPKRKDGHFRMAESRRKHLQRHLHSREGYAIETIRQGSPHTLVITKNDTQYQRERADWESRRDEAKRHITDLARNPWLKKLLGDNYEKIIALKVTDKSALHIASKQPLGPSQNTWAGTENKDGKKRKSDPANAEHETENKKLKYVEIVDLTSE